jgi:hypothetical protein
MEHGKKITTFLIDGTPNSPRTIELGNWSGIAIYSTQAGLDKITSRQEFLRPGVYILKSEPTDQAFSERVYIGEAEEIGKRLKEHIRNEKIDFEEVVFFTSTNSQLTKAHVKYLESRIIQTATEAGNSEVANAKYSSLPNLHEADVSDMEYFIDQIKLVLPTIGFLCLRSVSTPDKQEEAKLILTIKSQTFSAIMHITNEGYIVKKDSEANKSVSTSISDGWKKLREKLIKNGVLFQKGDKFIFSSDTAFISPSAASSIILGRQSAGTLEWVDDKNLPLKTLI